MVEPKKLRLQSAERILAEKQRNLADAKAKLQELSDRLARLQTEYNEKLEQKEELRIKVGVEGCWRGTGVRRMIGEGRGRGQ